MDRTNESDGTDRTNDTNSERNLFFWMDGRRAAHFFLFPLYFSLSPRFQPVMGGRKRKRKDKE
jgi:hypothetical protein